MNFVSLLIYLADVLGTLDGLLSKATIFFPLVLAGAFALWFCQDDGSADKMAWQAKVAERKRWPSIIPDPGPAPDSKLTKSVWHFLKLPTWIYVALCLASAVVPNANTIYAIAASQAAEKVLVSPTVEKAVNALNRWLDKQAK